jgi:hypothetical protein
MKRHSGMFKPGQSGNPNGRPKKFTIKDYLTQDDVDGLVKLAHSMAKKGDRDMLKFLLEHALGKAPQNIGIFDGEIPAPLLGGQTNDTNNTSDEEIAVPKKED